MNVNAERLAILQRTLSIDFYNNGTFHSNSVATQTELRSNRKEAISNRSVDVLSKFLHQHQGHATLVVAKAPRGAEPRAILVFQPYGAPPLTSPLSVDESRCCFSRFHLTTAAYFTAGFEMIAFSVYFFEQFALLTLNDQYIKTASIIMVICAVPLMLVSSLLIVAVKYRRPSMMIPHMIFQVALILFCLSYTLVCLLSSLQLYCLLFVIPGLLQIYFLYIIVRCHLYLKRWKRHYFIACRVKQDVPSITATHRPTSILDSERLCNSVV